MATNLTEAAYYARKVLKFGAIFVVSILVIRGTYQVTGKIIQMLKPPAKIEPDYKFGTKLPVVEFPNPPQVPPLTFQLETIDRKLPTFPDVQNVYLVPLNTFSFLTLDEAKRKAAIYDFKGEPKLLQGVEETTYQWHKGEEIGSVLTMRIINQNFDYRYEYEKDQGMINRAGKLDEKTAIQKANEFLSKGGFYHADLSSGNKKTILYSYDPSGLQKVYSILDADFIRVNYQRADINSLPVLSANPNQTNVSALVSSAQNTAVEVAYNYYPITTAAVGIYPIKSSIDAWNELKEGRAFVADLGDNQDGQVEIRQVYLAYFDPANPQSYLQPVYVFDGDNNFRAFVPALASNALL